MARFTVEIDTDNAAFDEDPAPELARILRVAASDVERNGIWRERVGLRDVNGNTVGTFRWAE